MSHPDFTTAEVLHTHIRKTLAFYEPRVVASDGGFKGCFLDDGTCYDPHSRQLVASARYVFNYATAFRHYGEAQHKEWAASGLKFLTQYHRQANGGYVWLIKNGSVTDSRIMAYGHAFVILAAAACIKSGIDDAKEVLVETYDFVETQFWDTHGQAYMDERDASLQTLSPYRGQNANMHMCEAMIAAWDATGDMRYLDRAVTLAERFAFELADLSGGAVWEHYDVNWQPDLTYNIDAPNDRYKPWGFQPGHQMEWAKLLIQLNNIRPDPKWLRRAKTLYAYAMRGWDDEHGGIFYGLAPDGSICSEKKYFWVQAESFATAWRLYCATGETRYREDYLRIWAWSWDHMIDHDHGAWYQVRARDGSAITDRKSPLGKTDYHTMGACWDVISTGD